MPFSNTLRLLTVLSAPVLLFGCTILGQSEIDAPPAEAVAVQSLHAEGSMIFQCSYDDKGFYWAFIEPVANLWDDTKKPRRLVATLEAGFTVRYLDGSVLYSRIIGTNKSDSNVNLPNALFETIAPPTGAQKGIRWMRRTQAQGGMPLTRCSPSQRGERLRIPFTARWVLYR